MCGGGGGGGGGAPKENPAVAVAGAPAVRSAGTEPTSASAGIGTQASRRRAQRGGSRNPMTVALDVSVANVGGSGATGLNIPKSR